MAFTLSPFTYIMIISILLCFTFPLLPVSADDSTSNSCPYPCLPAPVVPVTNCPPPPPPSLPLSPGTGYWSYPPPPPSVYNPYFSPPNKNNINMNPSPPPPNPMLPWYPWYYVNRGTSVSKGNCVLSEISYVGSILIGIFVVLMIH